MQRYNNNILLLAKRLLLALFLFFVSRIFFYVFNIGLFADITYTDLFTAFFYGMRFDISVICYFNIIFILLHLIPLGNFNNNRGLQIFLKIYFISINGLITIFNLSDSIYFHFVQKRSTADIFKFIFVSDDVKTLLPGFIADYWYVSVISLVLILFTWFAYPKYNSLKSHSNNSAKSKPVELTYKLVVMSLLLGTVLIGARGGLQLKPLSIIDASKHVPAAQMPLVLNSAFTVMTTLEQNNLQLKTYFSEKECENIYPVVHKFNNGKFNGKNIVVLLLESFSKEYVGFLNNYNGFTPFLDSLSKHSLVYSNAFANGLRSIDAIPAIVSGIPTLMNDPFITSIYNTNKTNSLPIILKEKGYHTSFFHGGTNGTMNFDGYASYAGFDNYYGRNEYDNDDDYDDYWGIYDEPFLQYFARKINTFQEPFFAFEFTLSSHYPYTVPEIHNEKFPEGSMKIHKVVSYTDYALREFFITASKMPWYNNTLFVIVADHPAQSVIPSNISDIQDSGDILSDYLMSYYKNTSGRYAIPLLLFNPGDSSFVGTINSTVQQTDLMPTILDYLNYEKSTISFGSSILSNEPADVAVQFVNGLYQITSGKYSLLFDGSSSISLYNNELDPSHKDNLVKKEPVLTQELEQKIKAILQQYLHRMINNDMQVTN